MDESKVTLGTLFKSLLSSKEVKSRIKGLPTQREIAKRLDVDESTVSKFLSGDRNFIDEKLIQLIGIMPKEFQIEYLRKISQQYKLAIAEVEDTASEEGGRDGQIQNIENLLKQVINEFAAIKGVTQLNDPRSKLTDENIEEISRKANIPQEELRRWQRGEKLPWDIFQVYQVARILDVDGTEVMATLGLDLKQSPSEEQKHHTEADCQNHHLSS